MPEIFILLHKYLCNVIAAPVSLNDITIRTQLKPGDLGYVIYRHGVLYNQEYGYGIDFESYVASGLHEFYQQYDPSKDRVWINEYRETIIGFLLLMGRPNKAAQLRYFFLEPDFRGIGLGKKMMELYMDFFRTSKYVSSYLWTTNELYAAASLYKRFGFKLVEENHQQLFGKK